MKLKNTCAGAFILVENILRTKTIASARSQHPSRQNEKIPWKYIFGSAIFVMWGYDNTGINLPRIVIGDRFFVKK